MRGAISVARQPIAGAKTKSQRRGVGAQNPLPGRRKRKAARRRLFNACLLIDDQAAIKPGFDCRRYAMKPRPAKPRSIIAHVEGSGTAAVSRGTKSIAWTLQKKSRPKAAFQFELCEDQASRN